MFKSKNILTFLLLSLTIFSFCNNIKAQDKIKSVKIGGQVWMTENLNVTHFRNGELILEAKSNEEWEKAGKEKRPAWCYYNNDSIYGIKHGKLYNWYAVNDKRGLAPEGWHIPTTEEYDILENNVGLESKYYKSNSICSEDKVNISGFSALFSGARSERNGFGGLNELTFFWTVSSENLLYARVRLLSDHWKIWDKTVNKNQGFSVRCVKD